MPNYRRALAALLISAMLCCTAAYSENADVVLPEPAPSEPRMILGESSANNSYEVTLYYPNENSTAFTSSTRSMRLEKNETLIEGALSLLMNAHAVSGVQDAVSAAAEIIGVEFGSGIATVNFAIDANAQLSDQAKLTRCLTVANTLLSLEGVEAVNLLTGDRSDAVRAMPLGAFTQRTDAIAAQYAQLQSEQENFLMGGAGEITRGVILYFPSSNGYFLPELRHLNFTDDNYAAVILEALAAGPETSPDCFSPFPSSDEALYAQPIVWINDAGERLLELSFSGALPNYLAFSGVEPWQLYGSIVLSLCSFVPELDGVRLSIEGSAVAECAIGDRTVEFSDSLMRRSDFSSKLGGSAALYFADSEGRLVRRECAMSSASAVSMRGLLAAMVTAIAPEGYSSVFPAGLSGDDILGVSLDDGVATVNLSAQFYARCQNLDAAEERCLIYAMVNALCDQSGVGAVRFLFEGMSIETLSQEIYLRSYLLPDPGIAG